MDPNGWETVLKPFYEDYNYSGKPCVIQTCVIAYQIVRTIIQALLYVQLCGLDKGNCYIGVGNSFGETKSQLTGCVTVPRNLCLSSSTQLVYLPIDLPHSSLSNENVTPSLSTQYCREILKECMKGPLEISFIMDSSASIQPPDFTEGLWFIQNFVDKFLIGPENVRVSMLMYGDGVYTENSFDFTKFSSKRKLKEAIGKMRHFKGKQSRTGDAIAYMLSYQILMARQSVRKIAIILTAGNTYDSGKTYYGAKRATEMGVEMFVVGIGNVSQIELYRISSNLKHVFYADSYNLLSGISKRLRDEVCGECPYYPVDIAFVIDSSRSMGDNNFTLGLRFIREFVDEFEINPSSARVAAVMYADRVYDEDAFNFETYSNKEDTLGAISRLEWKQGSTTNTSAGIRYLECDFFHQMRDSAAHLAIVITDGQSQDTDKTAAAAENARWKGITMFAIGVGEVISERSYFLRGQINIRELTSIAGTRDHAFNVKEYSELNLIKSQLLRKACYAIEEKLKIKHN
ncbi:hypothetical protein Btru_053845 [Bulinus truncatus]|nr:hypothetical protein Btru_053845 [Bulinus truncatus]